MKILIFRSELGRCDLENVFYYGECNKTLDYAERNSSIAGVLERTRKVLAEKNAYTSDILSIVEPVKENEKKQYQLLEMCTKIRQISAWLCIGSFGFIFLGEMCSVGNLSDLLMILMLVAFAVFVITKTGEVILGLFYKHFSQGIMKRIRAREQEFIRICQRYYTEIDDLYLGSLTLTEREAVLLRREQAEYNRKMEQYAMQQNNALQAIKKTGEKTADQVKNIGQIMNKWDQEIHEK